MTGLCPVITYAGCFGWAFLEWEYFCQQNIAPIQALFYPEGRRHVSYQLNKERKTLSCNPNVFIRTSLTFGIPTLNAVRTSSPAPLPVTGQFLLLILPEACCFLDALFLGGIIDLLWEAGGNCSNLSELQVISKQGWEYKELRGLYSLETWWEGNFSAFFSCSKERNCLGNSCERQKCILLNQISLDLSRLL